MCMVDLSEDDWVSFGDKVRRAAKDHKCFECSRMITKGEHYEEAKGLSDGNCFHVFRTCLHCVAARNWLSVVCHGWLYGAVQQDLQEHWDEAWELRSWWLGRIVRRMERRWTRRDGTLMPVPNSCPSKWTSGLINRTAA